MRQMVSLLWERFGRGAVHAIAGAALGVIVGGLSTMIAVLILDGFGVADVGREVGACAAIVTGAACGAVLGLRRSHRRHGLPRP